MKKKNILAENMRRFATKNLSELAATFKIAEGKLTNEGIFGTSYEKEQKKLEDALDRFAKYSMENGDSKDEVLSTVERKLNDIISIMGNPEEESDESTYDSPNEPVIWRV